MLLCVSDATISHADCSCAAVEQSRTCSELSAWRACCVQCVVTRCFAAQCAGHKTNGCLRKHMRDERTPMQVVQYFGLVWVCSCGASRADEADMRTHKRHVPSGFSGTFHADLSVACPHKDGDGTGTARHVLADTLLVWDSLLHRAQACWRSRGPELVQRGKQPGTPVGSRQVNPPFRWCSCVQDSAGMMSQDSVHMEPDMLRTGGMPPPPVWHRSPRRRCDAGRNGCVVSGRLGRSQSAGQHRSPTRYTHTLHSKHI